MKKILVPTDFSKRSLFSLKLASKIASQMNAKIHLLHLVELPSGIIDMGAGSNFSIPESMMYLRKVKENLENLRNEYFSDDIDVSYAIKFQNPFEGIQAHAKKIDADLIVMGSQGVSDFEEMIIGSNTEKVVRTADAPVIVVKTDASNFSLKNIVFASNFKDENKKYFQKLISFASFFDAKIHLLKVNTPAEFESSYVSKEKIKSFVEDFDVEKFTVNVYNDTSVVNGILHFSQEINADIIALNTHGRSGLSTLFNGSVTKSLSKNAMRPVVTFRL